MTDTRLVIEAAGAGMICTISGTTITFPEFVRGPYTTSNFIINLTRNAGKALATIRSVAGFEDTHDQCTVAAIDDWVAADRFALALTNQPTFTHTTIQSAWDAAANSNEIVVYPALDDAYFVRNELTASGTLSSIRIRGFSSTRKITWMGGTSVCITQAGGSSNDITVEDFHLVGSDRAVRMNNGTAVFGMHLKRCTLSAPRDIDQMAGFIASAAGAGSTMRADNCIFYNCRAGVEGRAANCAITMNFCLGIHCFQGVREVSEDPDCFNCVMVLTRFDYSSGMTGGSNNVSQDGSAPGSGVVDANVSPEADLKLSYWESPSDGDVGYPIDYRTIDGLGSILENAGTPRAGATDDIDGRVRDATNPNVGPTEGFLGFGVITLVPAEPDLSVSATGDGQVTLEVANVLPADTVTFFHRPFLLKGDNWTQDGTRVGNGTFTVSNLENGEVFDFACKVDN